MDNRHIQIYMYRLCIYNEQKGTEIQIAIQTESWTKYFIQTESWTKYFIQTESWTKYFIGRYLPEGLNFDHNPFSLKRLSECHVLHLDVTTVGLTGIMSGGHVTFTRDCCRHTVCTSFGPDTLLSPFVVGQIYKLVENADQ